MWPVFRRIPHCSPGSHTHTQESREAPCRVMPCSIRDCRVYQDCVRLAGWLACQKSYLPWYPSLVVRSAWLYSHAGFLSLAPRSYRRRSLSHACRTSPHMHELRPAACRCTCMQYHVYSLDGLLVARSFGAPGSLRRASIGRERAPIIRWPVFSACVFYPGCNKCTLNTILRLNT